MVEKPEVTQRVEIVFRLGSDGGWLDYRISTPAGVFTAKTEHLSALSGTERAQIREAFNQ